MGRFEIIFFIFYSLLLVAISAKVERNYFNAEDHGAVQKVGIKLMTMTDCLAQYKVVTLTIKTFFLKATFEFQLQEISVELLENQPNYMRTKQYLVRWVRGLCTYFHWIRLRLMLLIFLPNTNNQYQ
jgi:hypothetical protein